MSRFTGLLVASLVLVSLSSFSNAQPSPEQQKRIAAAIKAAANQTNPDYTAFVNPFIGTGELPPCRIVELD